MHSFFKSLAFIALGSMLPKEEELKGHLDHVSKGLILLVTGAMVLGLVVVSLLTGFYFLLVEAGQPNLSAGIITILVACVVAIVCLKRGEAHVKATSNIISSLELHPTKLPILEAQVDVGQAVSSLWNSFVKGYTKQAEHPAPTSYDYSNVTDDAELAAMLDDLKDLKHKIERERQNLKERIRMEAAIHENKDIIRFRPRDSFK